MTEGEDINKINTILCVSGPMSASPGPCFIHMKHAALIAYKMVRDEVFLRISMAPMTSESSTGLLPNILELPQYYVIATCSHNEDYCRLIFVNIFW